MNLRKTTLPGGFFVYGQRLLFAGLIRQHNKLYLKDQNVFTLFPLESNIITCIMPRPYIYKEFLAGTFIIAIQVIRSGAVL